MYFSCVNLCGDLNLLPLLRVENFGALMTLISFDISIEFDKFERYMKKDNEEWLFLNS